MSDNETVELSNSPQQETQRLVVVVDDVEDARSYVVHLLEDLNLQTRCCSSAKELLDVIQKEGKNIDLILLDLYMPDMDGLDVLRELKKSPIRRYFKVCVISGYDDLQVVTQTRKLGADDYLSKPFDKIIFQNRIRNLLSTQKNKMSEFAFVHAHFLADILDLPVFAKVYIIGVTEEGMMLESQVDFRSNSVIKLYSKVFAEETGCDKELMLRIIKSEKLEDDRYQISTVYFSMPENLACKIRSYTVRNAKSSVCLFS